MTQVILCNLSPVEFSGFTYQGMKNDTWQAFTSEISHQRKTNLCGQVLPDTARSINVHLRARKVTICVYCTFVVNQATPWFSWMRFFLSKPMHAPCCCCLKGQRFRWTKSTTLACESEFSFWNLQSDYRNSTLCSFVD